jgi:uncharacterized membrane protein YedE/YeeE
MAKKSNRISSLLAIFPAVAGLIAGVVSLIVPLQSTFEKEQLARLFEFFSNPLSAGAVAVYSSVILAITTVIIYQLARSARSNDRLDARPELPSEKTPIDEPEQAPLSAEERASRERARNLTGIRVAFTRNRRRMIEEAERIQRNGFLNLMIGILFSVIALGILGYPLFTTNAVQDTNWIGLFERFAPRFSVGILIQLIGFFFLRLYVAGENEVHYIRNEITNLESRLISYFAAAAGNDATAMRDIIKQLVRTERNFKLKKDERTLYSTDETYNDMRQLLKDGAEAVRAKARK